MTRSAKFRRFVLHAEAILFAGVSIAAIGYAILSHDILVLRGMIVILGLAAAWRSSRTFRAAGRVEIEEQIEHDFEANATVAQKRTRYIRAWWTFTACAAVLTVSTVLNLNALASGTEQVAFLPDLADLMYHFGGYWFAVLSFPMAWIIFSGLVYWKLRGMHSDLRSD